MTSIKITESVDASNSRLADLKRSLMNPKRVVETPKAAYIENIQPKGSCGAYLARITIGDHHDAVEVIGFGEEECLSRCKVIIDAFEKV